jgi:hypothetical protein
VPINLAPLFSSIGDIGNQYAGAKLDAAQAKLKEFIDKLKTQKTQTDLADSQERLRRLKLQPDTEEGKLQAQIAAVRKAAADLGIKLEPQDERTILGLPPGQSQMPGAVKDDIERGLAALPEGQRKIVEPSVRSYLDAGDTNSAMKVLASVAEKYQAEPRHKAEILKSKQGIPYGMEVGNEIVVPKSPKWNDEYQKVLEAAVKADQEGRAEQKKIDEAKRKAALARLVSGQNSRQMENTFRDYDAAKKIMAPWERVEDVAERAKEYVDSPTGPGDIALLLAYVEATKPQNGFRFTTTEQKMIQGSRGWIEAAQAKAQGGFTGIIFGDEQRKIVGQLIESAGGLVQERKDTYLRGILRINPHLYNILTDTPDGLPGSNAPGPVPNGATLVNP